MAGLAIAIILGVIARYALQAGWRWIAGGLVCASVLLIVALAWLDADPDEPPDPHDWGEQGERWSMSEPEFDALEAAVEANDGYVSPAEASRFQRYLQEALDELPEDVLIELDRNVAIMVADDGTEPEQYGRPDVPGMYGLYFGRRAGHGGARIVIFRDTLTRDFPDHDELRMKVRQTLRHEVAHHLGATERDVSDLGL